MTSLTVGGAATERPGHGDRDLQILHQRDGFRQSRLGPNSAGRGRVPPAGAARRFLLLHRELQWG